MKIVHVLAAASFLSLPVAVVSTPVMAASAHNSQAGSLGGSKNASAPSGMMMRKKQMQRRMKGM